MMQARLRSSDAVLMGRSLLIALPPTAAGVLASIGVFVASGELIAGIGALFPLALGSFYAASKYARTVNYARDNTNAKVVVTPHAVQLPAPWNQELPRAELQVAAGWYDHRLEYDTQHNDQRAGVFLHIRHAEEDYLLHAPDPLELAQATRIGRYANPPGPYEDIPLWPQDLIPLIQELVVL